MEAGIPSTVSLDTAPAQLLHERIKAEIKAAVEGEFRLHSGYARLAALLVRLKACEGWRELGHPSFNAYLLSVQEKFGKSVKSLYVYVSAAEYLLPCVGEADLDRMGITKADVIVRASKRAQKAITPELLAAALDPQKDAYEIRALAHQIFDLPEDIQNGSWFDFGGAFLSKDERKQFAEACQTAIRLLSLPKDMPDWVKRKKILLAFAAEFDGTYRAEVFGERVGSARAIGNGSQDLPNKESSNK